MNMSLGFYLASKFAKCANSWFQLLMAFCCFGQTQIKIIKPTIPIESFSLFVSLLFIRFLVKDCFVRLQSLLT